MIFVEFFKSKIPFMLAFFLKTSLFNNFSGEASVLATPRLTRWLCTVMMALILFQYSYWFGGWQCFVS